MIGPAVPNTGRFYVKGGEHTLSVFSTPVVIPDIDVSEPEAGHHEATVHAELGLASGPQVTECLIEYGLTKSYGSEVPCSPAPVYSGDQEITGTLPSLFAESDYHYRIKATNVNGWNRTFDNVVHSVAVLKAQTGEVTNLTSTSATLNGALDPDGMATTFRFQYGLDTNYDLETEPLGAGSGTGSVALPPVDVDKLQPGRTYHYRLIAENELGTTHAQDRTFTVPARPLISGLNPKNILSRSVDLHAEINDYNLPAEYFFEYGPTAGYGQTTPTEPLPASPSAQGITVHVEGLDPGLPTISGWSQRVGSVRRGVRTRSSTTVPRPAPTPTSASRSGQTTSRIAGRTSWCPHRGPEASSSSPVTSCSGSAPVS